MPLKADISDDGERIILDSEFQHEDRIRSTLGASFDKVTEKWSVPLTWSACTTLRSDFGIEFEATDALNDWGYTHLREFVAPARDLRSRMDLAGVDVTKSGRLSELVRTVQSIGRSVGLRPYQEVGAVFLAVGKTRLLFDEQGTGKTAQTITALRALVEIGEEPFPVLVVAPSSVKRVWETQFAKWYPGLTVVNVRGTAAQRRKLLATPAHVYITSYEVVSKHSRLAPSPGAPALRRCEACGGFDERLTEDKCQAHTRELNQIDFRTVITDEAHRMTNPKAAWTRAIWSVSDLATYRYALTGTPVQDHVDTLWTLLRFIQPKEFKGKSLFVERYAITGFNPWGVYEISGLRPERLGELQRITQPLFRRILKEVALPFLPPIQVEHRMVEMTGAQAKAYRDLKKTMKAELESASLTTVDNLAQAGRLCQLASSYLELLPGSVAEYDPESEETPVYRLAMPSNKVSAFMSDIQEKDFEQSTKGVVVFAQSRQLLELLSKEMDRADIKHGMVVGTQSEEERNNAIDAFQAGELKYILVSISAGGAGITLTAADTMVFLQRSWSKTAMEQAEARAHRLGSEVHDSIKIIHYLTEGTVELKQLETLKEKGDRIEEILQDRAALLSWIEEAEATE